MFFKSLKKYNKSNLIAKQVLMSRSKEEGMCCEVKVNEVKLRKYWSTRSGLPISKRQAVIEGKSEAYRSQQMTLDLNGVSKGKQTSTRQVISASDSLAEELLQYHHKFWHISFDRLREMAKQNVIPRRLAKGA